jgi:MFS family permease
MFLVGFTVTLAGQAAAYWLMHRLQRRSVVIFCMAALMWVPCVTCVRSVCMWWYLVSWRRVEALATGVCALGCFPLYQSCSCPQINRPHLHASLA